MKLIVIIVWALLCSANVLHSQTVNDIGKVVLGVRFLDGISQETRELQSQLEDKLVGFAAQSGFSSFGSNIFFISPNIIVNNVDVAEGGMRNVYVVQGELYLSIQDEIKGTVYSSAFFPFKGSATKKEMALKNAILNINYDKVQEVFSEAKKKILAYYEEQRNVIFAYADMCTANGRYDEAIACLMMIPEELTDLHTQAIEKALEIYDKRNEFIRQQRILEKYNENESILRKANSLLAMHNAQDALKILWQYRSSNSKQDAQYTALVKKAEELVSAEELEVLRKEERAYQDEKERETRHWMEHTIQTAHERNMENQEMELKNRIVNSAERIIHNPIDEKQTIAVKERNIYHQEDIGLEQIEALKTVTCEYIRSNPNGSLYVKF